MVMSAPERNTRSAASGSAYTLNSATRVTLPTSVLPPMSAMPAIRFTHSGVALDRQRHVGQRSQGDDPHVGGGGVQQEPDPVVTGHHPVVLHAGHVAQAGLAVDVRGVLRRAHQRPRRAGVHGRIDAEQRREQQRVGGRGRERHVAAHGRDAVHLRVPVREHQGDRVVVPGVAVDDHAFHGSPSTGRFSR